jgi:hypothetical protein
MSITPAGAAGRHRAGHAQRHGMGVHAHRQQGAGGAGFVQAQGLQCRRVQKHCVGREQLQPVLAGKQPGCSAGASGADCNASPPSRRSDSGSGGVRRLAAAPPVVGGLSICTVPSIHGAALHLGPQRTSG